MNDRDFVLAFERCAIAASDFHHADHIRLAWIYLREQTLIEAIERFTTSLRRFAVHNGVPGAYHETITWAYLVLVHERMHHGGAAHEWEAFRAANADLFGWKPSILERYYAPGTLKSDIARKVLVLADAGIGGVMR